MRTYRKLMVQAILSAIISSLGTGAAERSAPGKAGAEALAPGLPAAVNGGTNNLRMNFHNAPLNSVLEYLSEAAGFIINQETEVRGNIDVWSKEPVSREEAVALVNSVLKQHGQVLVRQGRVLTVASLDNVRNLDLEVVRGNNPEAVQQSAEVAMQIVPVSYVSAGPLANNLRVLLPASASLSVNESANALVLVAAKADIHRALRIIAALDTSTATVAAVKVFQLHYADATQLAAVVQQMFSTPTSAQGSGAMNGDGPGFSPGGGFGPPGSPQPPGESAAAGDNSAGLAAAGVTAVADEQSNSLIVSSPAGLLTAIAKVVKQIDRPVTDIAEMRLFPLANADPGELADLLGQLFPDTTNRGEQNQAEFRFGGPPDFEATDNQSATSERALKKSRVLAVADPRTASLLVSAPSTLLPQIAKLIERLDGSAARKEKVKVFELRSANPQDVNQVLQDLFNRNTTMRNNNSSNPLLGQNNPLSARRTRQTSASSSQGFSFGNSGGGTGGGTGNGGGAGP